jgi:hypothetical protein
MGKLMEKVIAKAKGLSENLGLKISTADNLSVGNTFIGLTVYAVVVTLILVL